MALVSGPTTISARLDEIAALIAHALRILDDDRSTRVMNCTIQARAAARALASMDIRAGTEMAGVSSAAAEARTTIGAECDPGALLAAAERELVDLPSLVRNEVAICAAAGYLRRSRRDWAGR